MHARPYPLYYVWAQMFNQSAQDVASKYEVRHQIGKGSFATALLVTNRLDKQDYVLKRVRLAKQTKWQRSSTLQERDLVRDAKLFLHTLTTHAVVRVSHGAPVVV
jgi:serine/threonine protein kinase